MTLRDVKKWTTQPFLVELNLSANQDMLAKQVGSITLKDIDEDEVLLIRKNSPPRVLRESKGRKEVVGIAR